MPLLVYQVRHRSMATSVTASVGKAIICFRVYLCVCVSVCLCVLRCTACTYVCLHTCLRTCVCGNAGAAASARVRVCHTHTQSVSQSDCAVSCALRTLCCNCTRCAEHPARSWLICVICVCKVYFLLLLNCTAGCIVYVHFELTVTGHSLRTH